MSPGVGIGHDGVARVFRLRLDHLPARELSPNARLVPQAKIPYLAAAKKEAWAMALNLWSGPPMEHAALSYVWHLPTRRVRDHDNLISAAKAYLDGIVAAGVLVSDDVWHLDMDGARAVLNKKDPGVEFLIREVL